MACSSASPSTVTCRDRSPKAWASGGACPSFHLLPTQRLPAMASIPKSTRAPDGLPSDPLEPKTQDRQRELPGKDLVTGGDRRVTGRRSVAGAARESGAEVARLPRIWAPAVARRRGCLAARRQILRRRSGSRRSTSGQRGHRCKSECGGPREKTIHRRTLTPTGRRRQSQKGMGRAGRTGASMRPRPGSRVRSGSSPRRPERAGSCPQRE
jgi:hypothetical protein